MIDEKSSEPGSNDPPCRGYTQSSTSSLKLSQGEATEATRDKQQSIHVAINDDKVPTSCNSFTKSSVTNQWKSWTVQCSEVTSNDQGGPIQGARRHGVRNWNTALLRCGPLSGILGMFVAIACIFACLGVLAGSNGAAVSKWTVQPSEYLAILTAVANLAMRYACVQGIVIAWWTRALRGSTLSRLHWDWRSGSTLIGALTSGRRMGWFGLACIFSILVTVDGPLLQRATQVVRAPIVGETATLNVTVSKLSGITTTKTLEICAYLSYPTLDGRRDSTILHRCMDFKQGSRSRSTLGVCIQQNHPDYQWKCSQRHFCPNQKEVEPIYQPQMAHKRAIVGCDAWLPWKMQSKIDSASFGSYFVRNPSSLGQLHSAC